MMSGDLSSRSFSIGKHMSGGGDDIDSKANQESTDGGVDWTKERENNSQKPYWYNHWQSHQRP